MYNAVLLVMYRKYVCYDHAFIYFCFYFVHYYANYNNLKFNMTLKVRYKSNKSQSKTTIKNTKKGAQCKTIFYLINGKMSQKYVFKHQLITNIDELQLSDYEDPNDFLLIGECIDTEILNSGEFGNYRKAIFLMHRMRTMIA